MPLKVPNKKTESLEIRFFHCPGLSGCRQRRSGRLQQSCAGRSNNMLYSLALLSHFCAGRGNSLLFSQFSQHAKNSSSVLMNITATSTLACKSDQHLSIWFIEHLWGNSQDQHYLFGSLNTSGAIAKTNIYLFGSLNTYGAISIPQKRL